MKAETPMPSTTYKLFAEAIRKRQQVHCSYGGYRRAICPIVLGHGKGEEMALVFQFGGESSSGLPPQGEWKCLRLAKVEDPELREGAWHAGASHRLPQSCVEVVDMDANPDSPYHPRRPALRLVSVRRDTRDP
jgi:hypothetical protein